MSTRLLRTTFAVFSLLVTVAATGQAQRVTGAGDDALVLPKGVFRFTGVGSWTEFTERYGMNTPGRPNGSLEPLGIDFNSDSLGVRLFPGLTPIQTELRTLTAIPTFSVSLGNSVMQLRNRVSAFPLGFEVGLWNRLMIGVTVPYITTNSNVFFNINTAGNNGNIAFNPALTLPAAFNADTALVAQFGRAASQLNASLA